MGGCFNKSVLNNVDDCSVKYSEKIVHSDPVLFHSSRLYVGWIKSMKSDKPYLLVPRNEKEIRDIRRQIRSFNLSISAVMILVSSSMINVPFAREISYGESIVFAFASENYFSKCDMQINKIIM